MDHPDLFLISDKKSIVSDCLCNLIMKMEMRIIKALQVIFEEMEWELTFEVVETSVRLNELLENDDLIAQERRKADVTRARLKSNENNEIWE